MCSESLLPDAECVRFKHDLISPRITDCYDLDELVVDGFVCAKIKRAWCGLKQSGKIAHDDLVAHLGKHGCIKAGQTDGLFKHETRDVSFTLVVDDFGVKHTKEDDVKHLTMIMREKHTFKVDMKAEQHVGIHLN